MRRFQYLLQNSIKRKTKNKKYLFKCELLIFYLQVYEAKRIVWKFHNILSDSSDQG